MSVSTEIYFRLFEQISKEVRGDDQQRIPKMLAMFLSQDVKQETRYALSETHRRAYEWIINSVQPYMLNQTTVYRAQVGVCWSMPSVPKYDLPGIHQQEAQTAEQSANGREPLPERRMIPDTRFVSDGRANAKGIPVLYCASDIKTALLEVRSPVGAACTLAHFRNNTVLTLADMRVSSAQSNFLDFEQAKACLKNEIATLFSKRVVGEEGAREYIFTQHIAEFIKQAGYDGIIYSSSQGDGKNYAFFEINKFELVERAMYEIESINITYSPMPETDQFHPSDLDSF